MSSPRRHHPRRSQNHHYQQPTKTPPPQRQIPISLGKPSLRRRLEDYYSLISPETVSDETEWLRKFDLIYDKYGGSVEGERTLASKLAKKYGDTVRLLVAVADRGNGNGGSTPETEESGEKKRSEEWFRLTPLERNSGIVDFASDRFDPVAALLHTDDSSIFSRYHYVRDAPLLDNISKARFLLPSWDPRGLTTTPATAASSRIIPPKDFEKTTEMRKKLPVFTALAAKFERGPLSLLNDCHVRRKRVRVLVRYVDCIRGTLTGYLMAFDKHMNMILSDVDEVYSPRVTKLSISDFGRLGPSGGGGGGCVEDLSNAELEMGRRRLAMEDDDRTASRRLSSRGGLKQRFCKQLLVRGDVVVLVWRADAEQSSRETETVKDGRSKAVGGVRTPGLLLSKFSHRGAKRKLEDTPNRRKRR